MQLRAMLLLLAVALGCTSPEPPAGQCRFDSDCAEGAVCAGNFCRTGCVTDRDCPTGQRCSESDRFGVLTCHAVVAQAQCNRTSECPVGLFCLDGMCRAQCQQDYDCQVINPFYRCVANACTLTCAAGTGNCDGDPRNGCEAALSVDASNCGACGTACTVINGQGQCSAGVCARARCNPSFDDCDGAAANGCEARIDSSAHCGRCGNACTTNMVCSAGACASNCAAGTTLCGASCVDTRTAATDCGRCGNACPTVANASPVCTASVCDFVCNAGYARTAAGCTAIAAPRLVSPASLSTLVGNRDAVFEVSLAAGTDGAVIELCRDRACTMVVERFTGAARVTRAGALAAGVYFWRAYGRVGTNAGLAPSAQTWEVRVPGRAITGDAASGSVLDVNGDGFADLAVGEPRSERVLVYAGSATGVAARPTTTLTTTAMASAFGQRVAAGDFNGDGFADLAVTAPDAQQVHVFNGGATGLAATSAMRTRAVFGTYGTGLAAASDLNHDGYADLIVGFSCFKGCGPGVDVYFGSAAGVAATPVTIDSPDRFSTFGEDIAALGRTAPGSALGSIVVLMRGKGGTSALVYPGTATGLATTPAQTLPLGQQTGPMTSAGDVNGDGLADLAVAVPALAGPATLQLFLGSAVGFAETPISVTDGENIGGSVAALGDVNGDGFGDLVSGNGFSTVRVLLGNAEGRLSLGPTLTAPPAPTGTEAYSRFGETVAFVGDLNRDGFDDVVIGGPDDGDTYCSGEVFVFPGRATLMTPLLPTVIVTVPDDRCRGGFGSAIASFARPAACAART